MTQFLKAFYSDEDYRNFVFFILCFATPAALGSTVSFLYNGGALFCLSQVATGRRPLALEAPARQLALALYAYAGAHLLSSVVNLSLAADAVHMLSLVPFLLFPFSHTITSRSPREAIALACVLGSAACCYTAAAVAAAQLYGAGEIRPEGGAGNAIIFATAAAIAAATSLAAALSGKYDQRQLLFGAYAAGWLAVLLSGSRMSAVALVLASALVVFLYRREAGVYWSRRTALVLAAAAIVLAAVAYPVIEHRLDTLKDSWTALMDRGKLASSIGYRLALWQIGLDAFRESPLFGHGQEASRHMIEATLRSDFAIDRSFTHFHNGLLNVLVEAGIVGAAALVAIFVVACRNAVRALRAGGATRRFGATLVLIAVVVCLCNGLTGILIGNDIVDAMLMIAMVVGTHLAALATDNGGTARSSA